MKVIYKEKSNIPVINENKGVTYLTYPSLCNQEGFTHAFSTRLGGVSSGIYSSMNLSFTRGDDEEKVRENFRLFTDALDIPYESIVMSDQTHTTNVRRVYKEDCGHGLTRKKDFFDTDGLITNERGVTLFISVADCVPLLFIDPVKRAVGAAHSGWRGTIGRIGKITIQKMTESFGSNPEDIVAAIGSSICCDCYEVSKELGERFIEEFKEDAEKIVFKQDEYFKSKGISRLFYKNSQVADVSEAYEEDREEKYQLDLWQANWWVLRDAGIKEENISMPGICTCCNPDFLFSHRASHGQRGNMAAVIMIK